jgi:hypothetical protein
VFESFYTGIEHFQLKVLGSSIGLHSALEFAGLNKCQSGLG